MMGLTIFNLYGWKATKFLHIFGKLKNPGLNIISHCKAKTRGDQIHVKNVHTCARNGPTKVLFFGSDDFALKALESLHAKYISESLSQLEVVVTSTNRKNTIKEYATKHGLTIHSWPIKNEVSNFDIGIVASFGHLIPLKIIQSFPLGLVNIHASLLPRWRGAAPIQYAILNGDKKTGVTLMKIKPKRIDVGDIVAQKQTDIVPGESLPELRSRLAVLGANLLTESWENLPKLLESAKPQNDAEATHAPKITALDAKISLKTMTAEQIYNLHLALLDQYWLHTMFDGQKIKLIDIRIITPRLSVELSGHIFPGYVMYYREERTLIVKSKTGWIAVDRLAISGRASMTPKQFYNGFVGGKGNNYVTFD